MRLIINGRKKMNNNTTYKYFAFISYNQKDTKWGKRLQHKLESYKMPATLCSERGWERKPITPVFFAPYEIQPGDLDEELKARLRASQNLIVVCSPNSAQSEWVGKEIRYFHSLGRAAHIYFFIVGGVPNSGDERECYNPVIKELGMAGYLGVNVHERVFRSAYLNRERAYVQLVTKLLGVEFDAIWKRHRRLLAEQTAIWCVGGLLMLGALYGTWSANRPIDVRVKLHESSVHNASLPPLKEARVTLTLDNDKITKVIGGIGESVIFPNIPVKMMGKEVNMTLVDSVGLYEKTDTTLLLAENVVLNIYRNPRKYGMVNFRLISSRDYLPVAGCKIAVEGVEGVTDEAGYVSIEIPLEKQQMKYRLSADVPLVDSICSGEYDSDGFVVFTHQ